MCPTKRNYRQSTQKVKINFTLCVPKLFTAELHSYKITNKTIINILTAALCYCESLFAICRSLAEQLPKFLFKKAHRLAIDLVLIPYHGQHYQNENEVYRKRFGIESSYRQSYRQSHRQSHRPRYRQRSPMTSQAIWGIPARRPVL